jgi:hypothetical protein
VKERKKARKKEGKNERKKNRHPLQKRPKFLDKNVRKK